MKNVLYRIQEWFNGLFSGRCGVDEFGKLLLRGGLLVYLIGLLFGLGVFRILGLGALIYGFVRAFSKNFQARERENIAYISILAKYRERYAAWKDRRSQSKEYKFFKCPGCGTMLRVPRGKGKIHIKCKCGYTLYRKT